MKTTATKEQFPTDARGNRIGVLLDLSTYQRLQEAAEDLADIQAYDAARPKVMAEIANGRVATLAEYRTNRGRKARFFGRAITE